MSDDPDRRQGEAPDLFESVCEWCRNPFAEDFPSRFCSMRCERAWHAWRAASVPAVQGERIPF